MRQNRRERRDSRILALQSNWKIHFAFDNIYLNISILRINKIFRNNSKILYIENICERKWTKYIIHVHPHILFSVR